MLQGRRTSIALNAGDDFALTVIFEISLNNGGRPQQTSQAHPYQYVSPAEMQHGLLLVLSRRIHPSEFKMEPPSKAAVMNLSLHYLKVNY
jgi:hypothetical protein